MKVVLFCGGQGMRLRDYSEEIPKPMIPIGYRPILWHIMKYYAHHGHKDFILCLGYRADVIKNYFLNYDECVSNDFVLSQGGKQLDLLNSDIHDWRITFVDTGINANVGQRLKAVQPHLEGEEYFLANYADGVTDCPLPEMIETVIKRQKTAAFLSVRPSHSFHVVRTNDDDLVTEIAAVQENDLRINGGYFVLRKDIFDYLHEGEELVVEPFRRLIPQGQLLAYPYNGFWVAMDTFKEKQLLDQAYARGDAPWIVWSR